MDKKRLQIILFILGIILLIPVYIYKQDIKNQMMTIKNYNNLIKNAKEDTVILIGKKDCSYCTMFLPVIDKVLKENNKTYHYIDITTIKQEVVKEMLDTVNINIEEFGTPTTIIVREGKLIAKHIGYMEEEATRQFFKNNKFIGG